jgi:two-component system NarL family response regulator
MSIRVLLADDHRILREALRDTLSTQPDIAIVGEAGTADETVALTTRLTPDVLVLDIGLPDRNGMDVALELRRIGNPAKIVALSAYSDRRFVSEMLRAGASGYVTKVAAGAELVLAIRTVMNGQCYLCPEVASALAAEMSEPTGPAKSVRIAKREREVLRLIASGVRTRAIAAQLNISAATVEVHRRNLMRKLGMHTIAELTQHAIREGLVPL